MILDLITNWNQIFVRQKMFGGVLYVINLIMFVILFIMYFYQNLDAIIGLFTKPKKFKEAKKNHKYAYLICAHDEEKVVGQLIDSIYNQDYPKELMTVFVCADNCQDNTANVAREHNAICYERKSDIKGKSYALDFMFKEIIKNYNDENFEAIFIFDADNLVSKNYTKEMNKSFDSGILVSTSYRESKNFNTNWVSAGASMCFYRECVLIHHSRAILNIGTYISGTGFYISYDIIKEMNGWPYHTMVEDIEFSIYCAQHGILIGYNEQAIFYDEQPVTLKASLIQRLRWCKGTHQCFFNYEVKKPKEPFKTERKKVHFSRIKFEMFVHVCPLPLISLLWMIFYLVAMAINTGVNHLSWYNYRADAIYIVGWFLISLFGIAVIHALIVTLKKHKQIEAPLYKQLLYCITFPIYAAFFLPLSLIALFKKVKWTKIEHNVSKSINDMKEIE